MSVHGCFDVVHTNGTTYVITPKYNPLVVENAVVVTYDGAKLLVYKVKGYDVVINGTRVRPNTYEIEPCGLAFSTLEHASASFIHHWCSYHQTLGVGYFFIYDNNSSEEEFKALVEAARPFPGLIVRWNYPYKDQLGHTTQSAQQTHTLCVSRGRINRIGLLDLDEYLVLHSGTMSSLLAPPCIRVQWRWFGQAGKTSTDPRDYTRSTLQRELPGFSKILCDPLAVEIATIHDCWGPRVYTTVHTASIHHYRGLSNDKTRQCNMTSHSDCRFCAVDNLDLVRVYRPLAQR
jgi:hypothetical protein